MKFQAIITRFLKGLIGGSAAALAIVKLVPPTSWSAFGSLLNSLALVAAFGGLTGLILALEKWARWDDSEYVK